MYTDEAVKFYLSLKWFDKFIKVKMYVRRRCSIETTEHINTQTTTGGSFLTPRLLAKFKSRHPNSGAQYMQDNKSLRFYANILLYLGNDTK